MQSHQQEHFVHRVGGYTKQEAKELNQYDMAAIYGNIPLINQHLGLDSVTYKVNSFESQVVAGTNYFLQLTSDDGKPCTVLLHIPLPFTKKPASISYAKLGHHSHEEARQ